MLFMKSLFKILNEENKRAGLKIKGYVNDGLLISVTVYKNKTIVKLQEVFVIKKNYYIKTA